MAEFIEVRTTIEGHEQAAALAHAILLAGLATSIDIAEVPSTETGISWQITLITPQTQAAALAAHIRANGGHGPIDSQPVLHDIDARPDWLTEETDHP
ncbi:hypothetical protein ACIBIZ_08120 [Nonomuraea spiralis]|uniref:hypothetical protein n=1 Tax=Nonomuraea TaxID=83681 RepID=UPI000F769F61|nr:hypothetical protein [Nonomuraea sp. WAC 01424]RSN07415.1 hypothetical protein DMB42_22425 [Nonomuraea sp. WAC 01424]